MGAGRVVVEVDARGGLGAATYLLPQDPTRPADPRQACNSARLRHQQAQVLGLSVHGTSMLLRLLPALKGVDNVLAVAAILYPVPLSTMYRLQQRWRIEVCQGC